GIDLLFVMVLIGNFGTAITNPEPIVTGPEVRPGLVLYDAFAGSIKDLLNLYLPWLLGRSMLRSSKDLRDLMRYLVLGGLIYSFFCVLEVRLSPQFHRWLYGFHQMDFGMSMRFGGYRPMVFMLTGMATAMFVLSTAIAATARWRAGQSKPWAAIWLSVVLLLCKSTGAIVYGMAVLPIVAFVRKPKMWLPTGLAVMVIFFPLLRGADLFPADTLVEWAEKINEERALSLWFRFDQEEQLMERWRERPIFGWGTYNRHHVYDPETGEDLSITDGDWMIQLGTRGLAGFIGLYGLLALAVVRAWRRHKRIPSRRVQVLLAAFALISSLQTVDLLPNGLFHYLPFFFAGALEGLSEGIASAADRAKKRRRYERARRAREGRTSLQLKPRNSSVPDEPPAPQR
ncbi:MAG: O-antigen ligase family protein, partial [Spirochaetota bacterium]